MKRTPFRCGDDIDIRNMCKKGEVTMVEKMKKNSGFTLVELIVAVALFAIVIGPLFQAFSNSIKANSKARSVLKATQLATSIMDNVERFSAKELREDFTNLADYTKLLPKGMTNSPSSKTVQGDNVTIEFKGVTYQDLNLNIKVVIEKTASNLSNKYHVYRADVYVHANRGVSPALAFTNDPLAHMRGSVKNIQ